ncbi:MAG TPA: FbpB family small basic protein [Pseudoneobacillus sp.]|nr:FbpB family small basic protein [Pseudoneobacillus sp.]
MKKRVKVSFLDLMKRNKEEILKDKKKLEKIEKRIDERYINSK